MITNTPMKIEEVILEKIKIDVRAALADDKMYYIAKNLDGEHYVDRMSRSIFFKIKSYVLGKRHADEYVIHESPRYKSWRHQLIGSLPDGWRKRFLCYFWDISEGELGTMTTHFVRAEVLNLFPHMTLDVEVLGNMVPISYISDHTEEDEI